MQISIMHPPQRLYFYLSESNAVDLGSEYPGHFGHPILRAHYRHPFKAWMLIASCIGAPLPVVKYMGDWAEKNSLTNSKYIVPTMTPSPATWRFFGWLAPSPPLH
jgi:hypothetical protein